MTLETLIEIRASQALAEIRHMARMALEEIDRRFAFINRSNGQKKRWAAHRRTT